jgi:hypothetical protein
LVLEAQIEETFQEAEALARDDQLDQGDGSEQSTVGSGAVLATWVIRSKTGCVGYLWHLSAKFG